MRFITCAIAVIMASAFATAAAAGGCDDARSVVQHIFDVADEDASGTLDRAEYSNAGLEQFGVSFDEADANADGETSMAEYLELYERHHSSEGGGSV